MQTTPQITLLVGPAASGKTAAALRHLAAPRTGRALLLVPGGQQQQAIRQRAQGIRRIGIHQFDSLARLLLRGSSPPAALDSITRTLLLRAVLREMAAEGQLPTFAAAASKPGFVALLSDLIAEAQHAMVAPHALAAAGVTPYDAELGAMYAAYCASTQQHGLADAPRRLELALAAARGNPGLLKGVTLLVVDGFDQFTPLQLALLHALAQQVPRTLITLTWQSDSRPALRRFARTRQQLIEALQPDEHTLASQDAPPRAPALQAISTHLFDLDAPPAHQQPAPADSLLLIEAADHEREVRAILRHVRRLLDAGSLPEQIAVLLRAGDAYAPLLREVAAEYALPLTIDYGLPLVESPPINALLLLLRLPLDNYPCRAISEVWRSFADGRLRFASVPPAVSACPLPLGQAASLLERVALHSRIAGGLYRLRPALQALSEAAPLPDMDEGDPHAPPITPAEAAHLLALLAAFNELLSPPGQATLSGYVAWLRQTGINQQAGESDDTTRRFQALHCWEKLLDSLSSAADTLNEPAMNYASFLRELTAAIQGARYGSANPQPGRVAVLSVLAARGLHFDHVIVPGMCDGEFPMKLSAPPLYSRRERAILARRGLPLLPPDPADEHSLFYETAARARCSLTLSRAYLDESGNLLPVSPYVNAVRCLFARHSITTTRIPAGSTPTLDEALSLQEQLIALMQPPPGSSAPDREAPALLAHVRRACAVEQTRESLQPYTAFDGLIDAANLREALTQRFGAAHRWSVTQFNDYITCPFRFFAAHVLHLRQRSEPEEGLESAGVGIISHDILAKAGADWLAAQHPMTPDNEEAILALLDAAASEVLGKVAARADFVAGTFWLWEQADLRQRLARAIRRMLHEDSETWAGFRVASVERGFGLRQGTPPLMLQTPAGPVRIVGRIDRLDQREDGALALIDYKSSSSPRTLEDTRSGRDVQLAIYMLAAEQLIAPGQRVERAVFFHLGSGKRSPALTDKHREETLAAMQARVAQTVQGVHSGHFAVHPPDACAVGCAFAAICRLNLARRNANR